MASWQRASLHETIVLPAAALCLEGACAGSGRAPATVGKLVHAPTIAAGDTSRIARVAPIDSLRPMLT